MKIGIISDIHEDVLRLEQSVGILLSKKCDKLVCLGDLVGYSVPFFSFLNSRSASDVIDMVKKQFDIVLVGNHDLFVAEKKPIFKAGFKYSPDWYKLDYFERSKISNGELFLYEKNELPSILKNNQIEYLRKLPEYVIKKIGGIKILFSHYAYPDLSGSHQSVVGYDRNLESHFRFMKKLGCQLSFSGHEHQEGVKIVTPCAIVNHKFGKVKIDTNVLTWISGPCIAQGSLANGVMIFDTNKKELEIIPINQKIKKNLDI